MNLEETKKRAKEMMVSGNGNNVYFCTVKHYQSGEISFVLLRKVTDDDCNWRTTDDNSEFNEMAYDVIGYFPIGYISWASDQIIDLITELESEKLRYYKLDEINIDLNSKVSSMSAEIDKLKRLMPIGLIDLNDKIEKLNNANEIMRDNLKLISRTNDGRFSRDLARQVIIEVDEVLK